MATNFNTRHIELARSLPPRLLRFFARYPPQGLVSHPTITSTTSSHDQTIDEHDNPRLEISAASTSANIVKNPFKKTKDPISGNFHDPVYSLRRQAELFKLAGQHGVAELLPYTPKDPKVKLKKREQEGLKVRGTGVGQRVKGHWNERSLKGRLEDRRKAMIEMPRMIRLWKARGHGRYWRHWPK